MTKEPSILNFYETVKFEFFNFFENFIEIIFAIEIVDNPVLKSYICWLNFQIKMSEYLSVKYDCDRDLVKTKT